MKEWARRRRPDSEKRYQMQESHKFTRQRKRKKNEARTERLKHLELWAQHNLHKPVSCFREHNVIMLMKFNKSESVPARHTETLSVAQEMKIKKVLSRHHEMRTLGAQWYKLSSNLRTHLTHFLPFSPIQLKIQWKKNIYCVFCFAGINICVAKKSID